jgi:cation-transporting P-type ATPase E
MQQKNVISTPEPDALDTGLSEVEAESRRRTSAGRQRAVPAASRSYWDIIRENVFTFINIVLFGLGTTLLLLGRVGDALISTGVISLNVLVSVVQEVRAKRTLDRIALLTRPQATVIRDGAERVLAPDLLVSGDVLVVRPGDQIVVDGVLGGPGKITVDESLLTGESNPVAKRLGEKVFAGTFCLTGASRYVAEQVGPDSLANQITAGARAFRRVLTPLQQEIYLVLRIVLLIVVYFEFLLVLMSLLRQVNLAESVENSTIVAGLVPNGLFLSIAVAYALGAVRILRYGALVQQANAIESLSHVNVLCLDKTGTLTANRMQVDELYPLGATSQTELAAVLGALAASAGSTTKTTEALAAAWPTDRQEIQAEIPFSSARKWSAVSFSPEPATVESGPDKAAEADDHHPPLRGIYALGAPEMLRGYLEDGEDPSDPPDPHSTHWQSISAQVSSLAQRGLRVLLAAYLPEDHHGSTAELIDSGDASELPRGMQPLGLVSLRDELRPEAKQTLASFIQAGVQPKIISGDDPQTVAALAREVGVITGSDGGQVVSGPELQEMGDAQFSATAQSAIIFGRISPQQKARLVSTLREQGYYVAMIGDGVNDVLSLKQAHLSIAMQGGSQAARSVADVVLMQDSFAVLVPAVVEGQRIQSGMQDILKLFLTRISTVGLVIFSSLVVGTFPLELRQGSIVTLFSVGIPTVLLVIWARPTPAPRSGQVPRLVHFILPPVITTSVLALLLFAGMYLLHHAHLGELNVLTGNSADGSSPADALAIAETALTTFLVCTGLVLIIFVQPPTRWWVGGNPLSGDWRPTWLATGLLLVFVIISLVPGLRSLFLLSPLTVQEYALVLGMVVLWLLIVRWIWRARLLGRFLGVNLGPEGGA